MVKCDACDACDKLDWKRNYPCVHTTHTTHTLYEYEYEYLCGGWNQFYEWPNWVYMGRQEKQSTVRDENGFWEGAAQSMQDFTKSYIDMHRKINCQSSSLKLVIGIFMRIQVSSYRLTEDALKFYGIFNECVVLVWTSQMFVEIKWCHLKF